MVQELVAVFFLALISVAIIIILSICQKKDEIDNRKLGRVLNQPVQCQFCKKYVYFPCWFGRDWACAQCWDEYGLDDRVCTPPKKTPWLIAEIEIEELKCDDKL
jgi:hypothetical protein